MGSGAVVISRLWSQRAPSQARPAPQQYHENTGKARRSSRVIEEADRQDPRGGRGRESRPRRPSGEPGPLGTERRAAKLYRQSSSVDPRWGKPLLKLGMVSLNRGDLATAREYFRQVVARDPDTPEAAQAASTLAALP